ncbi:NAD(P)-dependent oxidoreductase [Roseateles sp. L2-2]|uniref:NAD(P)-dependent oxidoreductase n=1 Tax=Roseateles TaxID=93681 RepID=UPI003D363CEB
MSQIALLGVGAMGSRMALNLLRAGHRVTVWNRRPAAAKALVEAGARWAGTPKDAAAGAEFVIAMVRDNEASRQVWIEPETGAAVGMQAGSIAIESSTLTPAWTRELGATLAARGIPLLDAPVVGSTPQAELAQLIYLVGGDAAIYARSQDVLTAMGSSLHHVGPLGSGAMAKLVTNALLGVQVTTIAELIGLLKWSGIDASRVLAAVSRTPAWSAVAGRVSDLMLGENHAPQFPIELIDKDFGYVLSAAADTSDVPTIAAAGEVFRTAMARGLGRDNMTGVIKLFT